MERKQTYPSDTSEEQWVLIEPLLLPAVKTGGRPETPAAGDRGRDLYVVRTECAWRQLPADFPPWQTVYWYFVRGQHPAPSGRDDLGAELLQPDTDRGVEPVRVQALHEPSDCRLRRASSRDSQRGGHLDGQVSSPFSDRDERPGTCGDRAHRHRQHRDQAMTHPARLHGSVTVDSTETSPGA